MTIHLILMLIALVLLAMSALNVPSSRVNLLSAGLAFWLLALIVSTYPA
jgi:hypothetical protein